MSTQNKELVARYINQVVNTGNTENIEDFVASDYTEVYRNQRYFSGVEGAREHIRGVRQTYPDLHLEIEMQLSDGDWVITSYNMTGTHSGEWMGIKPTGKRIAVTGVNLDRISNGRIAEHGGAANLLEPLLEIGAIRLNR